MNKPKIYGLIGYPVKHSLSPFMHNAAFEELKINADYRLFEVKPQELKDFLLNPDKIVKDTEQNPVRAGDILGFNITIPHKVRAKEIMEEAFPFEKKMSRGKDFHYMIVSGAINTVKREKEYTNTDADGFLKSLREDLGFETKDKIVFVIGCGGAGRAVISGLSWISASIKKLYIYEKDNKTVSVVREHFSRFPGLKGKWEFIPAEQIPDKIKESQLLVNASPVGMKETDLAVIDRKLLHKDLFIYDVVYNRDTRLIQDAKSLGLPAIGGLGMLLYQGTSAFEFWTGQAAPIEVMRKALNKGAKRL
ncbi:MAG: shikimate dehydrogenase [Candidatus Omnitrophica bacterium]|nr:shikimate dehydrogenase [Candidatus Omnitrophota bacterium]